VTRRIRFSLNRDALPSTPDGAPGVGYGILEGEAVVGNGATYRLAEVRLLPPCWPTKIVCVGRNYREHAAELGNAPPTEPLIFLKPVSALAAHGDAVLYPAISARVDYEGELGVVIGRRARHVKREDAAEYVRGYTCLNDVTARDLQQKDGQWTRAKGFDTFCPVGPWMVPRDEVRFDELRVRTFLDGQKRQDASVLEMIFPVSRIIEFVTEVMTLEPGDLIATGTPAGIGPMQAGSVVRVEIEGLGALENRVVKP
jgi:2-keto-4-pentenoate hydratase/2-oxohepta-3-ene-1,7-dioic acid hydratase in catechol pathway